MGQRKAVTAKLALAYRRGSRKDKSRILNELCELTGWNRDWARAQLRLVGTVRPAPAARTRRPIYTEAEVDALAKVWRISRCPTGKRLQPMLQILVPLLRAEGALRITDRQARHLMAMSAATIDRRLAPERARLVPRGRSHTKPGTLLKSQIPIRTWADWDDARPGFVEIDLVAHEGGDPRGEFCHTLDVTDVATGWTELRAVPNKAQKWVFAALLEITAAFPFPVRGIDSDNGSEFINAQLLRYCEQNKITFTRSRAGRKNDGAYVEQKNWSVVRQAVGYHRYDTDAELALLNQVYALLRLMTNFFCPQQKLLSKHRTGAKVTKHYDTAKTPYQRVLADPRVPDKIKTGLTRQYQQLNPAQLRRDLLALNDKLLDATRAKHAARQRSHAPASHPWSQTTTPHGTARQPAQQRSRPSTTRASADEATTPRSRAN